MTGCIQSTVIRIPAEECEDVRHSVPCWEQIADPSKDYRQGIVRHGGIDREVRFLPSELKPSYPCHVQEYLQSRGDAAGAERWTLLAVGCRNTQQNLGLPGWSRDRRPKLLCRPDEPIASWTYYAICGKRNGGISFEEVSFQPDGGGDHDVVTASGEEVDWAVTGQRLSWDGENPTTAELAASTYDLRHVYRIAWEDWQNCAADKRTHDRLMESFMSSLREPIGTRGEKLERIADEARLPVQAHYLHSAVGLRPDGTLVFLIKHGSLADLGTALRDEHGCARAILLDNGGSCGAGYYSRRSWAGRWQSSPLPAPVYLGAGSYFRPKGHSLLLLALKRDFLEPAFRPSHLP